MFAREEKFESSADVILRREGGAEATTATDAVTSAIADAVREDLVIILEKTDVCCFELYPVNDQKNRKRKDGSYTIAEHSLKDFRLALNNHLKRHQNAY